MDVKMETAGAQIQGGRDYQEDSFGIIESEHLASGEQQLLLLADGMGGHAGGATASRVAIEVFSDAYLAQQGEIMEKLTFSLSQVTEALGREVAANPQLKKMGTTLIGAVVTPDGLQWLSVGDSPMWLYRNNELIRLNEDHSMAGVFADMVEMGRMTEAEAKAAPNRNALRSVVSCEEAPMVDVSSEPTPLKKGDLLVMASDGLETLTEAEICDLLDKGRKQPVEKLAESLLQEIVAISRPGQDNTTVVLYRHGQSQGIQSTSEGQKVQSTPTTRPSTQMMQSQPAAADSHAKSSGSGLKYLLICMILAVFAGGGFFALRGNKSQPATSSTASAPTKAQAQQAKNVDHRAFQPVKQQPVGAPEQQPAEVTEQQPAKVAEQQPVRVTEQQPVRVTEQQPAKVVEQQPVEVAEQQPAEVTGQQPAEVTEQQPVKVVEQQPVQVTEQQPVEAAKQ